MTSLDRMLSILDLFREDRFQIQSEDVVALAQCSRATAYRYLRSLCACGLLAPAPGGAYVLGSRVIEMDRLLRRSDPLLTCSRDVMTQCSQRTGLNMMLCSHYRNQVMCVDTEWIDTSVELLYERGKPMPMFRGAMAKVILANLSPYQLKNLMLEHAQDIRSSGLGQNWKEFKSKLNVIRREGVCVSNSEVMPNLMGIAAPVFDHEGRVIGSVVFVVRPEHAQALGIESLCAQIKTTAQAITARITQLS